LVVKSNPRPRHYESGQKEGVNAHRICRIIHGKNAISTDMSIRPEQALGTSAETWLAMQAAYALWQARRNIRRKKIARIARWK
jgi:antitoxin HigA-1